MSTTLRAWACCRLKSHEYAAFSEISYGDLIGGDPAPTAVAALEALLQPRRSAKAQLRPQFDRVLHLLYMHAWAELGDDESRDDPEETAGLMANVFRAASWKHDCMLILPAEGSGQAAELRAQLAVLQVPSKLSSVRFWWADLALLCDARRERAPSSRQPTACCSSVRWRPPRRLSRCWVT